MTARMQRLLPMPATSFAIAALWLMLAPGLDVGNALLAAMLAVVIPWFTHQFWPDHPRLYRPLLAARLFGRVLRDIIVANWQVARLVLDPRRTPRAAFVDLQVAIEDPFVATILASIISLTPGTVSLEYDRAGMRITIHVLDASSPEDVMEAIRRRYEAPLKEIFRC